MGGENRALQSQGSEQLHKAGGEEDGPRGTHGEAGRCTLSLGVG